MKQRLIDANALLELMHTYDDYQGAKEAHDLELIHRDSILFAIENAPTVDAVPIDFLKQFADGKRGYYSDFVIEAVKAYRERENHADD